MFLAFRVCDLNLLFYIKHQQKNHVHRSDNGVYMNEVKIIFFLFVSRSFPIVKILSIISENDYHQFQYESVCVLSAYHANTKHDE